METKHLILIVIGIAYLLCLETYFFIRERCDNEINTPRHRRMRTKSAATFTLAALTALVAAAVAWILNK